jgi:hypothetical protein
MKSRVVVFRRLAFAKHITIVLLYSFLAEAQARLLFMGRLVIVTDSFPLSKKSIK